MSIQIVGFKNKDVILYAIKLRVALQMTNLLREISEDHSTGRLYEELWTGFNVRTGMVVGY